MGKAIAKDAYTENYTSVLSNYFFEPDVKLGQEATDYILNAQAEMQKLVDQYNERYAQ